MKKDEIIDGDDCQPEVAIVIPARLNSTRLPNKLLLAETGKPLVVHTYENALQAKLANSVTIATDSKAVADACVPFSSSTCLFHGNFRNGTQRVAAAVPKLANRPDIVVNLQGDAVGVTGEHLDSLISHMQSKICEIATIVSNATGDDRRLGFTSMNCVKVAAEGGICRWFSRQPLAGSSLHVGVYAFRTDSLLSAASLPLSRFGAAEKLEQLDWIAGGMKIESVEIRDFPISVNTIADYHKFCRGYQCQVPIGTK